MKEFTHFFAQSFAILGSSGTAGSFPHVPSTGWQPLIDIYECSGGLHILVELPGIDKDQLSVSVEENVLKIAGFRPKAVPASTHNVHQMEIPYGHFARYVRLPASSNVDQINAKYENGYLTIEIPRNNANERR